MLIDQSMGMLYHEHVKQYVLHIDATGSLKRNIQHLKKFCIILLLNISQLLQTDAANIVKNSTVVLSCSYVDRGVTNALATVKELIKLTLFAKY